MKVKVLGLAIGCAMMSFGGYAQKGVDSGTPFGHGEDSVRCVTNISLFVPYAKSGNFKDAYEFWKKAYDECPGAHKDIYLYGAKIYGWQISNAKDAAKKNALINDLMSMYDKRIKYFGDDQRYGKNWIIAHKLQDYVQYMGDAVDNKTIYDWSKGAMDEFGEDTESGTVSMFAFASLKLMQKDPNLKSQYIQDYLKCSAIFEKQLKDAQTANNDKLVTALNAYKSTLDVAFANSGAADCETLQKMYSSKVEEVKNDLPKLKEIISLLRRVRCQEIDAFYAAGAYAYKLEPSADAALGIAKQAVKVKDYDKAMQYFEEAAKMETANKEKAEDYYLIAVLSYEQGNNSKSRQYCLKAIETNGSYGDPYILIGNLYAKSARSIYPDDPVLAKAVYYAAIDKFEKAKAVDSSCAAEANKLISTYRAHLPSTEEIFMHPDLDKGKPFRIGGWIGETVIVR